MHNRLEERKSANQPQHRDDKTSYSEMTHCDAPFVNTCSKKSTKQKFNSPSGSLDTFTFTFFAPIVVIQYGATSPAETAHFAVHPLSRPQKRPMHPTITTSPQRFYVAFAPALSERKKTGASVADISRTLMPVYANTDRAAQF
jgi:hypothetical protein